MGSGYKNFTAGSVLTASDVNNYLMEQSVMVFASAAARDSAITSPEAGMVVYIDSGTASEGLFIYDGSSWRYAVPNSATPLYAARVSNAAVISLAATTWTTLANWGTEDYDYNNNMNVTTGVYTAPTAGLYEISAHCSFTGNNNPQAVGIAILKNDTTFMNVTQYNDAGAAANITLRVPISDCLNLAANDNIRIKVWNGGGNNVNTQAGVESTHFAIRKVPA